jgi:3-hydroxybutyryl-CoA dehydrogenase
MQVGVKGTPEQVAELTEKIGSLVTLSELKITHLGSYDLIFDLDFDLDRMFWTDYLELEDTPIILGTVGLQLEGLFAEYAVKPNSEIIGMNTLPTFINIELAEVCLVHPDDQVIFEPILEKLGFKCTWVKSRVGFVTPRVVLMIINEAYYTVQEGTASKEDIDLGMKLGTNYPKGPFEWAEAIGIEYVYLTLEAIYEDTKDPRYKICPMLKTAFLSAL